MVPGHKEKNLHHRGHRAERKTGARCLAEKNQRARKRRIFTTEGTENTEESQTQVPSVR